MAKNGEESTGGGGDPVPNVLFALAVGRLGRDTQTGELDPDQHTLLADNINSQSTAQPTNAALQSPKKIRNHLKAILKKGGHKLTAGKRLRLRNDEDDYDVHILSDHLDDPTIATAESITIIFFVLTVPDFNKYYSITNVLRDYKAAVYSSADSQLLATGKPSTTTANAFNPIFTRIMLQYAQSPLKTAESKVAAVKTIMSNSVAKALNSVEQLEDMEEASERMEEDSKVFQKRAKKYVQVHKRNYYYLLILLIIVIFAIALYFIIPAATSSSSSTPHSSSSSSTAGNSR